MHRARVALRGRGARAVRRVTAAAVAAAVLALTARDAPAKTARSDPRDQAGVHAFVVVVNDQNPTTALPRTLVSRFFLKKATRWESGVLVLPVDLPPDSPVREAFTHQVLGRSVNSVKAYWQQQIFSGRDVPPPEKPRDDAVLEFVQSNAGALAYVSPDAALPRGVRAITVTD